MKALLREAKKEAAQCAAALREVRRDIEQEEIAMALPPKQRAALYEEAHTLETELTAW